MSGADWEKSSTELERDNWWQVAIAPNLIMDFLDVCHTVVSKLNSVDKMENALKPQRYLNLGNFHRRQI